MRVTRPDEPPDGLADALEALYGLRYHRLLRVAEAIIGDPDLAHDAVQEAFARALDNQRDFRADVSLEGWVWRIVVNTARNARRSARPAPLEPGDIGASRPNASPLVFPLATVLQLPYGDLIGSDQHTSYTYDFAPIRYLPPTPANLKLTNIQADHPTAKTA
jgi:DNA-directed RNA polymerase specialized sigma24 family protein